MAIDEKELSKLYLSSKIAEEEDFPEDRQERENKKKWLQKNHLKMIVVFVIILISISSLAYHYYINKEESRGYWTFKEAIHNEIKKKNESIEVDSYKIKDVVNYTHTVKIPGISFYSNEHGHYFVKFNFNDSLYLTAVRFADNPFVVFFEKTDLFKDGERVKFVLERKEFQPVDYIPLSNDKTKSIEPIFYTYVMNDYLLDVGFNKSGTYNYSVEKEIDGLNGSFNARITFNEVKDFYPNPLRWNEVNTERFVNIEDDFTNFSVEIYDKDDNYVADLMSKSSLGDRTIQSGDYLVVKGEHCIENKRYSLELYVDNFEGVESKTYLFWPFTIEFD